MPGGDRTGPWGQGPQTGRAAGFCAGYSTPGYVNPVRGFGGRWLSGGGFSTGRGRGGGRGMAWRHGRGWGRGGGWWWGRRTAWPWPHDFGPAPYGPGPFSREEELAMLKEEAKAMEAGLEDIRTRMAVLEKAVAEKE